MVETRARVARITSAHRGTIAGGASSRSGRESGEECGGRAAALQRAAHLGRKVAGRGPPAVGDQADLQPARRRSQQARPRGQPPHVARRPRRRARTPSRACTRRCARSPAARSMRRRARPRRRPRPAARPPAVPARGGPPARRRGGGRTRQMRAMRAMRPRGCAVRRPRVGDEGGDAGPGARARDATPAGAGHARCERRAATSSGLERQREERRIHFGVRRPAMAAQARGGREVIPTPCLRAAAGGAAVRAAVARAVAGHDAAAVVARRRVGLAAERLRRARAGRRGAPAAASPARPSRRARRSRPSARPSPAGSRCSGTSMASHRKM